MFVVTVIYVFNFSGLIDEEKVQKNMVHLCLYYLLGQIMADYSLV